MGNKLGGRGLSKIAAKIQARLPGWHPSYISSVTEWRLYRDTDGALGLIISPVEHAWIARSIKGYGDVKIGPTTFDEVITFARLYLSTV